MLKQFERELLTEDWHAIREGLEVKLCPTPDGEETRTPTLRTRLTRVFNPVVSVSMVTGLNARANS